MVEVKISNMIIDPSIKIKKQIGIGAARILSLRTEKKFNERKETGYTFIRAAIFSFISSLAAWAMAVASKPASA
jgi:hypothetical protein